ncbi:hypothetical protein [Niastella sp. OAS944]|uniref:hypothetical protein n=1 Tax=Niastella sp. OAS944 TaxID=2664089 RepID=UPI003499A1D7|nr:hypothetical protein [Chitinophagaceae bacterium OAS944]
MQVSSFREYKIQVTGCRLPVAGEIQNTGYRLQVAGFREYKIQVTGCRLQVAGEYKIQVAGYRLPGNTNTGSRLQVTGCREYKIQVAGCREYKYRLQVAGCRFPVTRLECSVCCLLAEAPKFGPGIRQLVTGNPGFFKR